MIKKTALVTAMLSGVLVFGSVNAEETLDRGLVAVKTSDGIYLSWRLHENEDNIFGTATKNTSFKIYKNNVLLAENSKNTNYIDKSGKITDKYYIEDASGTKSEIVKAFNTSANYRDITLTKPADVKLADGVTYSYKVSDSSCGDLDGDGVYEIIIEWACNEQDNSKDGYTGPVLLDAYKLDGTRLWGDYINLGQNIRAGAHYAQFLVYDFDMDGKAEITCQTAPGSKDSSGAYVSSVSSVDTIKSITTNTTSYVNSSGRILTGDEFFTIFDGETGKAIDTIYYPNQRVDVSMWGDDYGNRCDRFTATVAWLDGERPYAVYMRGYYLKSDGYTGRQTACAITFDGEKLDCVSSFDTNDTEAYKNKSTSSSYHSNGEYKGVYGYSNTDELKTYIYRGNGNHNCAAGDFNGDGKDEVTTGATAYHLSDGKLLPLWCTFKGHGDATHLTAYDPTRDGLDLFVIHEMGADDGSDKLSGTNVQWDYGYSLIDAPTGKITFHQSASDDTGRGMMANVGIGGYYQMWASVGLNYPYCSYGNNIFRQSNVALTSSPKFRIFWDGDLYDELLEGTTITSYNGTEMKEIFEANSCAKANDTGSTTLSADLFGDWREELCYATSDYKKLRIYTTNIYTDYKMKSLMYDRVYRNAVSAQQTAYNQPPHIGFYADEAMLKGGVKSVTVETKPTKTMYNVGDSFDLTGMKVKAVYNDGTSGYINAYTVSGFDNTYVDKQTISISLGEASDEFDITVGSPVKGLHASASVSGNKYTVTATPQLLSSGKMVVALKKGGELVGVKYEDYTSGKYQTEIECTEGADEVMVSLWNEKMKPISDAQTIEF